MSALTTPDNIYIHTTSDPASLPVASAAQATSIQAALAQRQVHTFKWANDTERAAETGMKQGDLGDQADTDTLWRFNGSNWKVLVGSSTGYPVAFLGITVGSGTVHSTYTQVGDTVNVVGSIRFGMTTEVTGYVYVSLPVDENAGLYGGDESQMYLGGVQILQSADVLGVPGFVYLSALRPHFAQVNYLGVVGGVIQQRGLRTNEPVAWQTGSIISWNFSYVRQ